MSRGKEIRSEILLKEPVASILTNSELNPDPSISLPLSTRRDPYSAPPQAFNT